MTEAEAAARASAHLEQAIVVRLVVGGAQADAVVGRVAAALGAMAHVVSVQRRPPGAAGDAAAPAVALEDLTHRLRDLAQQALKDPYVFDFLALDTTARERELERGLLDHIQKFMLEMGVGFAFVGRQAHLEIAGQDYYLDLLFYHLKLRCFVVIDLKVGEFKPEYAGKMNFYLSAVDDLLRHPSDQPSIGLILWKSKHRIIVEYALRDTAKPMGVAEFRLIEKLPKRLKGSLPSIEESEAELSAAPEAGGQSSRSASDAGT